MKLLVVSQHFWPENFRINDLVAELVARGHDVTVLTGLPNYPDGDIYPQFKADPSAYKDYAGATIVRIPVLPRKTGSIALALNFLSFAAAGCLFGPFKLAGKSFDAVFCFGPSPVTVVLPAIVMKWFKRAPLVFWVLDLWPQSLEAVGAVRSRLILSVVDKIVGLMYRGCDLVLGQSRGFLPQIARQLGDPSRVAYFANWSEQLAPATASQPAPEVPDSDSFDIVLAGNIGEAQDFPSILEAARLLADQPVRWLVVGDGRKAEWVAAEIARLGLQGRVLMLGRFGLERMPSFFSHADALLVSLRKEPIFALTIPGRLQSYLAAGIPVLAMLDGEGADVVRISGAGFAVDAGDARGLAEAIRRMMAMSAASRAEMGKQGPIYSAREFDRATQISRLETYLSDLVVTRR